MHAAPTGFMPRLHRVDRLEVTVCRDVWRSQHDASARTQEERSWSHPHVRAALASGRAVSAFKLVRELLDRETIRRPHYDVAIAMFTMVGRDGTGFFGLDAIRERTEELGTPMLRAGVTRGLNALTDVGVIERKLRRRSHAAHPTAGLSPSPPPAAPRAILSPVTDHTDTTIMLQGDPPVLLAARPINIRVRPDIWSSKGDPSLVDGERARWQRPEVDEMAYTRKNMGIGAFCQLRRMLDSGVINHKVHCIGSAILFLVDDAGTGALMRDDIIELATKLGGSAGRLGPATVGRALSDFADLGVLERVEVPKQR